MITTKHNQTGFTLIELLLYIAIISTLLVAVSLFLSLALSARVKNQSIAEVNQQGTMLLEKITTTLRGASAITSPAAGATGTTLNVATPNAGTNPTIFDLNGSVFQIKEGGNPAVALTNEKVAVSGLTFKNLSRPGTPGTVQISFTLSRVNPGGRNEYTYQKTFTVTVALR